MINVSFTDRVTSKLASIADKLGTAIAGGVNDSATQVIDLTKQNVLDMIAIDRMNIDAAFGVSTASEDVPQCKIQIDARHTTDLNAFNIKQTDEGVEVKVYRFQPPVLYPDTFGPNQRRLPKGIYRRVSKRRFPIVRIKSIQIFGEEPVVQKINSQRPQIQELSMKSITGKITNLIEFN